MWATGDSAGRGRWPANSVGNRSGVGWGWDRCAGRGSGRERGAGTKRAKNPCPSVSNREMIDVGAGQWWTGAQRRAAAGSRRGYSEAGGCSLVGWVRRQRRTRTGGLRCVCSGVEDWSGQELVFSRLLGKGGGTWSRVVRAGESRELEFKMLRGRGAERVGGSDGGQQGGSSSVLGGEKRGVCAKIQCGGPFGSRSSLQKTVKYCPASTTYFISRRPEWWLATPVQLVGQMDLSTHCREQGIVAVQLLACRVLFSRPGSSRRTGAKSVGWPARQLARDRGDQVDRCGAIKRTPFPHYGRGGAGLAVGAEQ